MSSSTFDQKISLILPHITRDYFSRVTRGISGISSWYHGFHFIGKCWASGFVELPCLVFALSLFHGFHVRYCLILLESTCLASRVQSPVRCSLHIDHQDSDRIPVFRAGYLSRKALPIKRNDAEPLTREDVQYDLLDYIFSDKTAAFTSTVAGRTSKICFSELYINALYSSAKCSKVLKDKMIDTPAFATELAKFSLLTNVGRINTTMACKFFFPL